MGEVAEGNAHAHTQFEPNNYLNIIPCSILGQILFTLADVLAESMQTDNNSTE